MNIRYGGSMSYGKEKFSYSGGVCVRDLFVDPDLLTWSVFEEFISDRGIKSKIEQVWYKVVKENISSARSIYTDKDTEIRKLCKETEAVGEVDLYIVYGQNADEEKSEDEKSEDENREEVSDEEEMNENEIREKQEKAASGHQWEDKVVFGYLSSY
uniref:PB1-like domain-containing protein n=2 Tax=Brassica TaxID=3705 RepID=A0A3P6GTL5_BRAOL|nr:unnamed protein product [Brassica oleracea]